MLLIETHFKYFIGTLKEGETAIVPVGFDALYNQLTNSCVHLIGENKTVTHFSCKLIQHILVAQQKLYIEWN
jgi:hypothetical protein